MLVAEDEEGFFAPDREAAGRLAVERALEVGVVCFLALGDREPEAPDRDDPDALLLCEPVGEDVRVAMAST